MVGKFSKGAVCLVCVLGLSGSPEASAGAVATAFSVRTIIGGNVLDQAIPTAPGKRLILPAALSDWNCRTTDRFYSDDGSSIYVNVVCSDTNTPLVVGMSIACPVGKEGSDSDDFFMRSGTVNVEFTGECSTFVRRTAAPAAAVPGTHL